MKQEDRLLTKIFKRVSNELEAIGAVSKKAFWQVADHFLGNQREQEIKINPKSIREETRAEELLQQKAHPIVLKGPELSKDSTPTSEKANSALEAVYEEMKHPAYTHAKLIKKVFEKGLQLYGTEQAIAYWEGRKEGYMQHYQQNLTKVDTELNSPHLSHLTDNRKDQTRETAKQNPIKTLDIINIIKNEELVKQERDTEEKISQEQHAKREHIEGIYRQFWQTQKMLKDYPSARPHYKDFLKSLAKELAQDKTFMEHLKTMDPQDAKLIEQMTKERNLHEQEHTHSLNRGKGGISL